MSFSEVIFVIIIAHVAFAAEEPQGAQFHRPPSSAISGTTTGFTVGKQYNLDAKVLKDGTASASVYGMLGGQVGPGPTYYSAPEGSGGNRDNVNVNNSPPAYYYDAASGQYYPAQHALSPEPTTSIWSPSNVNYYVAGGVFGAVVLGYGLYAFFTTPSLLKGIGNEADDGDVAGDDAAPAKKETAVASKKARRRREVRKNEEAARLASIVLTAIESGECLQKSICLMGSQLSGTEKGKLATTLLKKLVPDSVQENQYFLTLQNALAVGPTSCNQFHCKY